MARYYFASISKVFYIDFGNEEDQPISGLFRMPSELIRLPALCVSLAVDKDMLDIIPANNWRTLVPKPSKSC